MTSFSYLLFPKTLLALIKISIGGVKKELQLFVSLLFLEQY